MTVYTQNQINQLASLSTTEILARFQVPVVIQVVRSERTNTPCIVFHSDSGILCNVLARKHSQLLAVMQPGWNPWVGNAARDKEGQFFSTVALKGLRPSTLQAWVAKATAAGFVIDDQVLSPTIRAEVTTETVVTEVVTEIPSDARPVAHKPFGLPGKVASVKDLKKVLRAQGKSTAGNKAALLARL